MNGNGEQGGEKTHEPTQKRLEDARKKGDIAKSTEVGVAASYLALLSVFALAGPEVAEGIGAPLKIFLDRADDLEGLILAPGGLALSAEIVGASAVGLAPLLLAPLVAMLLAYIAQRAVVLSPEKLAPKLSRISPIATAKQKFGPTGLVEFAKSAAKLIAISLIAFGVLAGQVSEIVGAARATPAGFASLLADLFVQMMIWILVVAVVIAAIDFVWQRSDHRRRLRMSFQELKDEQKQAEGDPQLKSRRRQRAVDMLKAQSLTDVKTADVVVVNPVHVAVALTWSREAGTAPVCVAKGVDQMALRIREIADEAGVPLHRDVACARALYELTDVGEEIPVEQYRAVAAAIRFAEEMRAKARAQGRAL
ncbi:MAG: flagellar type III secretion system protein FlhB [Pseudomonadota bacterium]